jgi:hypothetical protein
LVNLAVRLPETAVEPHLQMTIRLMSRFHHTPAICYAQGHRLFDQDVQSSLEGPHCNGSVRDRRGGHQHGVDLPGK